MRITTKGRYALRAVIALARHSDGRTPVSIKRLSELEGLSPEFLEQIFYRLRKSGLVASVRGPGGGFLIATPLSDISLKDILSAAGEGLDVSPCEGDDGEPCARTAECVARSVWKELDEHLDAYLSKRTLDGILKPGRRKPARKH